jgi:nucleoside-diphosphate-sugar epimerase
MKLLSLEINGAETFNVASGTGSSLQEVIDCIESNMQHALQKTIRHNNYTGVSKNVLNIDKLKNRTNWVPEFNLSVGIKRTFERKLTNLGRKL